MLVPVRIVRLLPWVRREERRRQVRAERLVREHRQRTGSTDALFVDVVNGVVTDVPNPTNDPRVAKVLMPKFTESPPSE
jgi:hypothetical protein